MDLNAMKAKYERQYLNGLMYMVKGDYALASNYLRIAMKSMQECLPWVDGDEERELRETILELAGHLKDLNRMHKDKSRDSSAASEAVSAPTAKGEEETSNFAFKKEDIPDVSFADVIGLEAVKQQIRDMVINPKKYAELYQKFRKKQGGGVIMYGPPGNGKTMIAKAIAHETGATFFPIKFSDLGSKWFGETEGNIRSLFEQARTEKSAVIFFDEIDAIAPKRGDNGNVANNRVVAELLTQMDGISKAGGNLTILAATNRLQDLDPAILRPGRFDEKIYIPLPDEKDRAAMFKKRLKGIPCEAMRFAEIAKTCEGFSGADIELVCEKAKLAVIREIIDGASEDTVITKQDLFDAATSVAESKNAVNIIIVE